MSSSPRRRLGDRNTAAIAQDRTVATPPAPKELESPGVTPEPETKTKATTTAKGTSAKAAQVSDTVRLGIYITPEDVDSAKSAYLADWQAGGHLDTFAKWMAYAFDAHAGRSVSERTRLARPSGRSETRTGSSRSFVIPTDTIARMREAIAQDQAADRWPSDSAWCSDAIAAAVEQSRTRAGGTLPTAPARLPNRLRR